MLMLALRKLAGYKEDFMSSKVMVIIYVGTIISGFIEEGYAPMVF